MSQPSYEHFEADARAHGFDEADSKGDDRVAESAARSRIRTGKN